MSLLHCLEAHAHGNLMGVQSTQRDWSPYLAHFTQWSAMRELRALLKARRSADGVDAAPPDPLPARVERLLDAADERSWSVVQQILAASSLRARSPSEKHAIPPCVCLSECTLPGLVSLCERYGRFGLVFSKRDIFDAGGRPCLYVGREEYTALALLGRDKPVDTAAGRLYALGNIYEPPRSGVKPQDYTHEREWRVFADVGFATTALRAVVAPARYAARLLERLPGVTVIPIDMLFSWGA
jgi:hypothetical protein